MVSQLIMLPLYLIYKIRSFSYALFYYFSLYFHILFLFFLIIIHFYTFLSLFFTIINNTHKILKSVNGKFSPFLETFHSYREKNISKQEINLFLLEIIHKPKNLKSLINTESSAILFINNNYNSHHNNN